RATAGRGGGWSGPPASRRRPRRPEPGSRSARRTRRRPPLPCAVQPCVPVDNGRPGGRAPSFTGWRTENGVMKDASALQVLVLLGVAVLALTLLARVLRLAPAIVLLLGGV